MNPPPFEYGKTYHIYNRGNNHELLFKNQHDYNLFTKRMTKYLTPTCHIYAFCLLPNHFHMLFQFKEGKELPILYQLGRNKIHRPFIQLFTSYVMIFNKRYNRSGSLFQEHLRRKVIPNENYFRQALLYIHLNPKKHLDYPTISSYPYSSYRFYLNPDLPCQIEKSFPIQLFDDLENFTYCHKQAENMLLEEANVLEY